LVTIRRKSIVKYVQIAQSELVGIIKSVQKLLVMHQASLFQTIRTIRHIMRVGQTQVINTRKVITHFVSSVSPMQITIRKRVSKSLQIAQVELVNIVKLINKSFVLSQTQALKIIKAVRIIRHLAQAQVAHAIKQSAKAFQISQGALIVKSFIKQPVKRFAISQAQVWSMGRNLHKTFILTTNGLIRVRRNITKLLPMRLQTQTTKLRKQFRTAFVMVQAQIQHLITTITHHIKFTLLQSQIIVFVAMYVQAMVTSVKTVRGHVINNGSKLKGVISSRISSIRAKFVR